MSTNVKFYFPREMIHVPKYSFKGKNYYLNHNDIGIESYFSCVFSVQMLRWRFHEEYKQKQYFNLQKKISKNIKWCTHHSQWCHARVCLGCRHVAGWGWSLRSTTPYLSTTGSPWKCNRTKGVTTRIQSLAYSDLMHVFWYFLTIKY